ncbi:MAG: DUF3048 domain-containing protein [Anaerolineaceae bacterium]
MNRVFRLLSLSLSMTFLVSACASTATPTLTTDQQTAVAQTLTAIAPATKTATVAPTSTPTPVSTNTATPTPIPTPSVIGPEVYGDGVNPLTGLKVDKPELLNRRPVIMKISNHQINYQPHWGLSAADIVWEYYIGAGANRFAALYYGQDSDRIGPVRSIRRVDGHIGQLYQAVFGSTGGNTEKVLPYLNNYIPYRYFTDKYLCPGVCDDGRGYVYSVFGDSAALSDYFVNNGVGLDNPGLTGMAFSEQAPQGGEAGDSVWINFSAGELSEWVYDEDLGKYQRFAQDESTSYVYMGTIDQNTNEILAFSNVILLKAEHTMLEDTLFNVELVGNSEGQPAIVFRDGKAYEITWKVTDPEKPIQFFDANGEIFPLKPGNTWMAIMGVSTPDQVDGGEWSFFFSIP